MAKATRDAYANVAYGAVTMSAANTLTFSQIQMGVGLFEGRAMCIHRIKYSGTSNSIREMVAATDRLVIAVTTSNRLTSIIDVSDPAMIDNVDLVGIAANIELVRLPLISDFTMLPGGGKLVPANPLWLAGFTAGAAAASAFRVQLEFTFVELSPQDYLEVIQSMFPANVI